MESDAGFRLGEHSMDLSGQLIKQVELEEISLVILELASRLKD